MDEIENLLRDAYSGDAAQRDSAMEKLLAMWPDIAQVLLRRIYHNIGTEAEVGSAEGRVLERLLADHPGLLTDALKNPDFEVRAGAAYAMWWLDESRSVEALIETMLNDPHPEVQFYAMVSLGRNSEGLKDAFIGMDPFVGFLSHDQARFRSLAANVLSLLGDEKATPFVIALLVDSDDDVRYCAVEALARLATPDAIPRLLRTLHEDPDMHVKAAAIVALGSLSAEVAVPDLIACFGDTSMPWGKGPYSHRRMCDLACLALEKIGTPEALNAAARWRKGELH